MIDVEGLKEAISYFKDVPNRVRKAQESAITSAAARARMVSDASNIVDSVVYSKFKGDTFAISQELVATEDGDGAASVGLPVNFATEAVAGQEQGQVTYARYMLPDFFQSSFLKGDAFAKLPRDFLTVWHDHFAAVVPEDLSTAIDQELSR